MENALSIGMAFLGGTFFTAAVVNGQRAANLEGEDRKERIKVAAFRGLMSLACLAIASGSEELKTAICGLSSVALLVSAYGEPNEDEYKAVIKNTAAAVAFLGFASMLDDGGMEMLGSCFLGTVGVIFSSVLAIARNNPNVSGALMRLAPILPAVLGAAYSMIGVPVQRREEAFMRQLKVEGMSYCPEHILATACAIATVVSLLSASREPDNHKAAQKIGLMVVFLGVGGWLVSHKEDQLNVLWQLRHPKK